MAEVASSLPIGAWDRPWPCSISPELSRCLPLELQSYPGGPHIDLVSFWNSIAPKPRNASGHKDYMQTRPSFSLSVQPPINVRKRRRSSAAPRRLDVGRNIEEGRQKDSGAATTSDRLQTPQLPVDNHKAHTLTNGPVPDTFSRAGDTLFSLIGVENGHPYDTRNRCDLCRVPFETDEAALLAHLARHFKELEGSLSCQRCQIPFSHHGDLKLHLQSKEHQNNVYCLASSAGPLQSDNHLSSPDARFRFCVRLRKWEQAQLHFHSRTIENLSNERQSKPSARSCSLPPRKRKPLESWEATGLLDAACDSHVSLGNQDGTVTSGSMTSTTEQTLQSLQQRIRDLMELVVPGSPDEQDTPYSEFCDTHSLPGSPEQALSRDEVASKTNRARSEPPQRSCYNGERTAAGSHDTPNNSAIQLGGAWSGASQGVSQKRSSDSSNPEEYYDGNDDGSERLQPKKRKTAPTEATKRFPCIYHVGEPVQFKDDKTRYLHISNMLRHLRSHNFFACSTCVLRFANDEQLQAHKKVVGHAQACSDRRCKRTKPANSVFESDDCVHIRNAEDEWCELFTLQFNGPPPNVFDTASSSQLVNEVTPTPLANASTVELQPHSTSFRNDCFVDYGMNGSFFDQAMDFNLGLPADSLIPSTPLNVDDFLVSDPTPDLDTVTGADAVSAEPVGTAQPANVAESEQCKPPTDKAVAGLQQQMAALERMISTQRANEKDQIQSLQEKVFQLEQKLYQSSEREQKLEAALHVIFDAFQASGAPSAQPDKPLWKLFMTHTGQAIGPTNGSPGQQEAAPSSSFMSMSPTLTFTALGKNAAQTPPDSTYGSTR